MTARQGFERSFKVIIGSDITSTDDPEMQEPELKVLRKGFALVLSLEEIFAILHEEDIISEELLKKLVWMVGFRNVIAHDYARVNYDIVFDTLQNGVKDIEKFIEAVSKEL